LNLHKTFCIPHGGGGPGVGPIGVAKNLAPFLPREFILDPETGRILFGEGEHGKRPPIWSGSDYRHGGGKGGNVVAAPFGSASIEVEDVAKRLMDYGFHAPTVSWPAAGTMMIEPTESEPKHELDRFCDAMISIHAEIEAVANGKMDRENNILKNAPHTAQQIASGKWDRPYSREQAAFPAPWTRKHKFWPAVARID